MPLFPATPRMPQSKRLVFPRKVAPSYKPTGPCGFLKLPTEIRDLIYKFVFVPRDIEIFWMIQRSKRLTHRTYQISRANLDETFPWAQLENTPMPNMMFVTELTLCNENNRHCLYDPLKIDKHPELKQKARSLGNQLALLRTCRTTYNEAVALYYSLHSFGFTSRRVLERFLLTINPAAKSAITALYLQHQTYGDPFHTVDIPWKALHDSRWKKCCENISNDLVNLKELRILFQINDRPLRLNLTAEWVEPLLLFQKRGLTSFGLELLVCGATSSSDKRLKSCANVVRRAVLGEEKYDAEEDRRRQALHALAEKRGTTVDCCFLKDPMVRKVSTVT